jgi:hypothetical protein
MNLTWPVVHKRFHLDSLMLRFPVDPGPAATGDDM